MGDRSDVTLFVPLEHTDTVRAMIEATYGVPEFEQDDGIRTEFSIGELNGGIYSLSERPFVYENGNWVSGPSSFVDDLIAAGIEFNAVDCGHFTFVPTEIGWRVGMESARQRVVDIDGAPVLTAFQWDALTILELSSYGKAWRVQSHFGDNPQDWL